jgi:signal peptidase I
MTFWLGWVRVEGPSMEPAFVHQKRVRLNPFAYWWKPPRRGDVVALRSPEDPKRYDLKRIVGLPGETISWIGGRIQVQGVPLPEPYARIHPSPPGDDQQQSLRLKVGEYFVAGDNRLYSRDSRHYGPVQASHLIGRVSEKT